MGFGDFMKGVQGGMGTMQDFRRQRQMDTLYDAAITEAEAELEGKDFSRARQGLPALKRAKSSDTLLGRLSDKMDPVIARWMEKLGRGTGTTESPVAGSLETSGEMAPLTSLEGEDFAIPELDPSQFEAPEPLQFADGTAGALGNWLDDEKAGKPKREGYRADSPEEIEKRAARARAGSPSARGAIPEVEGDPSKYRPAEKGQVGNEMRRGAARAEAKGAAEAIPEAAPKGRVGSAVAKAGRFARGTGAGMLAAGGVGAALENSLAPDEKLAEYYRRINRPGGEKDAGPWEAAGVRTMGVLQDVGRTFLPKVVEDKLFPYLGESEQAPAPAPQEAIPTGSSGPSSRRYRGQGAARRAAPSGAPAAAVPTAPTAADPLAGFDVTKFSASEIPNFSNNDWVGFRKDMMDDLIMNGMSYAEAWEKVDQQVVATQQRGFMNFGNQARALLSAGDLRGAGSAVRAAFQYLPTTTDIQVGEYNGHLVAFSVDEDTGEQVGQPMVITPEFLDSALMNFSDRKAWAEHAQDNRKLDQADRELGQGDKRLGILERANEIEAFKAETDALGSVPGGGGGGGLKAADIDRATQQMFLDGAAGATDDLRAQRAIVAMMARLYREGGGSIDAATIADRVARYAGTKEGLQEILAESASAIGN